MAAAKKNQSTTAKGLIGVIWTFSGSVIQIGSQFIIIGILARLLTPEDFGVVAIILIIVNFSNLFTNLGVASAIIQLKEITRNHIGQGYSLSVLFGLGIALIYYFLAPFIATFFELKDADAALRFFAIFFPLRAFNSVSNALLTRDLKFSLLVKCHAISYIVGIGLTSIILALLDFGYWALIWGQFAGLVLTVSLMAYFRRPFFSFSFDRKTSNDLLIFGSGHTLGTVFNYFGENSDNIIVGKYLGTVALGIYSKAFQLFAIPASFFGSVYDSVLFPILSKKQDRKGQLANFYIFSTALCFGLLVPIATILFINAELVVEIMLGDQWESVVYPFQVLISGLAFRFGTRINKSYLKSLGIVFRGAYYQLIFALLVLLFGGLGSYLYGLPGAAYGVFIATFLNYIQMSYRLYRELGFSLPAFLRLHGKSLGFHLPFYAITILLFLTGFTNMWLHLGLTLLIYAPIMVYLIFNRRNIIFHHSNSGMLVQIINALPGRIKKKLRLVPTLRSYLNKEEGAVPPEGNTPAE